MLKCVIHYKEDGAIPMSVGYTRKELGKLHRQFFDDRMEKSKDNEEAFQRALMSMLKAMIDVIDANNQKIDADVKALIKKKLD
ncbi:MAG: hypothetical protein H6Q73_2056 [Firmicutes bacterium]|nr:hypothetical protein [Bacillota bacterium]